MWWSAWRRKELEAKDKRAKRRKLTSRNRRFRSLFLTLPPHGKTMGRHTQELVQIFEIEKKKIMWSFRTENIKHCLCISFLSAFLLSGMWLLVHSTVVLSVKSRVVNVRHSWQFFTEYSNLGMPSYQTASSLHFQAKLTKLTLLGSDCSKCLWCVFDMEMWELQLGTWLNTIQVW